jgi:hypothetical protein
MARDVLRMSLLQLKTVINKVQQVRGRLERIEVRACNIGADPKSLEFFRSFFGVKQFLAPRVTVFELQVLPEIIQDDRGYSRWKQRYARPVEGGVYGTNPGPRGRGLLDVPTWAEPSRSGSIPIRITAAFLRTLADYFVLKVWETSLHPHRFASRAVARSWEWVQAFINTHIMVGSRYRGRGPFPILGLWTFNTPGQAQPYVLPKEPEYRELIMSYPPFDTKL